MADAAAHVDAATAVSGDGSGEGNSLDSPSAAPATDGANSNNANATTNAQSGGGADQDASGVLNSGGTAGGPGGGGLGSGGGGGGTGGGGLDGEGGAGGDGENSAGREARIAARKKRMEARRLAKLKPQKTDDSNSPRRSKKLLDGTAADADLSNSTSPSQTSTTSKSKQQLITSKRRIESAKQTSSDKVTFVQVAMTAREDARRQEEARKRHLWEAKKAEERRRTTAMGEEIAEAWAKAEGGGEGRDKGPYELNELLTNQKRACENLTAVKNKLFEEYSAELKAKDDEYVKELKRQAEEIDTVLQRMEAHHRSFQTTLREELEQIERAFVEERSELIDTNVKEIDGLFNGRGRNEARYMQERADRIDEHLSQLEALRVHDAEEYNLVKIKLETDVQVLEQQLQQMRATYQLNTEKLEYNYQVLKKRDEENGTILGTQKRRIGRLTDHLHNLKAKMNKQEKTFQAEYSGLTDDYKRITEQFKELQKKFHHFRLADGSKYRHLFRLNEETAKTLMRKLLQADQIIQEQQLGIKWTRGAGRNDGAVDMGMEELFRVVDPGMFNPAARVGRGDGARRGGVSAQAGLYGLDRPGSAPTTVGERSRGSHATTATATTSPLTTKKMLDLLTTEASFLVEEKLQKLLAPLHATEQSLMKLDSIFKALGVESMEDIEALLGYFVVDGRERSGRGGEGMIGPNEVVGAVRRFLEDKKGGRRAIRMDGSTDLPFLSPPANQTADGNNPTSSSPGGKATTREGTGGLSTALRQYWHHMANVIDDETQRVWTTTQTALQAYNAELIARHAAIQDISLIQQQNNELKNLLRGYMGARVNDELCVPPTKVLMVQAGGEG
ncbi:sperm tail-domain-containing protein [Fimicolochytrium jonesii]|uniref:sperm tail-domain-containing protein n=1 Tax=Fimicolochytrium jonesii TaxID=1396493 RepID=UPI0022FF1A14|nr:sperm tail-domain-containing protein [Fimicolochytrium jonesii]KAI8819451.1 sperm tail-domain-containing protein [Fimicolochytrium jonesii]